MRPVIGLDLSLTSTGIANHHGALSLIRPECVGTIRRRQIASCVTAVARDANKALMNHPGMPLVVIEAVPTHAAMSIVPLAMLHGVILDRIDGWCEIVWVGAMQRAGWATGSGASRKPEVTQAAIELGAPIPDRPKAGRDDLADAFHLRAIGLAVLGEWVVPKTEHRVALIHKLQGVT